LAVEVIEDHEVSCSFTGGFVSKRLLLPTCFDNDGVAVIPRTDTLEQKPPSFLPIPVNDSGQPMPSQGVPSINQVPIDNSHEEAVRDRSRAHWQSTAMASFTLLLPIAASPLLFPLSLLSARTRLLSSRLNALMMAFFPKMW